MISESRVRIINVELYETLKAITDCYGVGSTPEAFCRNVHDFMLQAREVLAKIHEGTNLL